MPTDRLNYLGINRAVSDYSQSSACEELINLRPTSDGLVPVKPFKTTISEYPISADKVYVHQHTGARRYICQRFTTAESGTRYLLLYSYADGSYSEQVLTSIQVPSNLSADSVHYASVGNIILISISDTNANFYQNLAFKWDESESEYVEINIGLPNYYFSTSEIAKFHYAKESIVVNQNTSIEEVSRLVNSGLNEIQESHPDVCYGPIIIAIAYKTYGDTTFWTGQWLFYDPARKVKQNFSGNYYYAAESELSQTEAYVAADYFTVHGHSTKGFKIFSNCGEDNQNGLIRLAGAKLTLTATLSSVGDWDTNKSIIRSIEIYASKPQLYFSPDRIYGVPNPGTLLPPDIVALFPDKEYNEMALGDQLLYHQASIPIEALVSDGSVPVTLTFGGNVQTTNRTLDVDAGKIMRFGEILSYNARFHFYNSVKQTAVAPVSIYANDGTTATDSASVFVRYKGKTKEDVIYIGTKARPDTYNFLIFAPSQNITQVIMRIGNNAYVYNMTPSSKYNYSMHVGTYDIYESGSNYPITTASEYVFEEEHDAINVTEQYNPFVFKVEHSYATPGNVLDVQPQMAAVSDTSYGTYPLNVFTSRGAYALKQGTGTVLYSAFVPISNIVSISNSVPTDKGTFIISKGGVWLVAGNKSILVSEALHYGPHKYIRDCSGYIDICGGNMEVSSSYDIHDYVSADPFLVYITKYSGAKLSYNRYRDELMVSNPAYAYTYVLSLKYRQWFKIIGKYRQDSVGENVLLRPSGNSEVYVYDLESEDDDANITAHLQSRPFSVGYQYSHIHRIVSMVRAQLGSGNQLVLALYGSDNLQDWTLIAYASRISMRLSQIRTAPAGRSWRYYTICIGGVIKSDTDFGPFLVDFKPVKRRIG